jgi:uncharacterized membrane protein (UPF0136 family)
MTIVYIIYALILIGGGFMGFVKAGSKASLISGIGTGLVAAAAACLYGTAPKTGLIVGAVVSAAAGIVFVLRYVKTKKAMPAVPMMIVSDLVLIASLVFIFTKK